MLILKRTIGQAVIICHDTKIILLDADWEKHEVLLGIKAPRNFPIHREEVYENNHQNKKRRGNYNE